MRHGETAARTIAARVSGGKDSSYEFQAYPVVVPLGGKYAIAIVGGLTMVGFWGWVLKELANLRYFLSILPLGPALKKWWHGALMYAGND
jgi:NADH dehydrogenase FAD-containing subunit